MKTKISLLLAILVFCFSFGLHAQQSQKFSLEGMLCDSQNNEIDFATVTVLSLKDSLYVNGAVTNKEGKFKITSLSFGHYILSVAHLLYKRKYIDFEINQNTILNPIAMEESVKQLSEVTVTANAIQYKADRYIISLQGNPIAKGNNTMEVLALMPGVTNERGVLKINGRHIAQIYVDGRKLRDRKELEAIGAENIDKVEVVHTSGSEESASALGGIVNIKLKKTPDGGYYGSTSANFSILAKDGYCSDNANNLFYYRHKKLSVYNYIAYGDFKNVGKYDINSYYKDIDQLVYMKTQDKGWVHSLSDRLSLIYELNKNHSIGGNFRIGVTNGKPIETSHSVVENSIDDIIDMSGSVINRNIKGRQYQAALNYDWLIDKKGSNFKFVADYLKYNNDVARDNTYLYKLHTEDEKYERNTFNSVDNKTYMLEVDAKFEFKLGNKSQLDIGGNYRLNKSKQLLDYQYLDNELWTQDLKLSDNYKFKGEDYAGFASFSSMLGKRLMYKAGVRMQQNRIGYNSIKMGEQNTKKYWGIYPTANLMYNINPKKGTLINFAYQRAMSPIPYSVISPVIIYNSEYSYTKGNLNIKPSNFHIIMLGGRINNLWNINYMFGAGKDLLYFKTFQDGENPLVTYTMPINNGKMYGHSFNLDRAFNLLKWWSLKANARLEWTKYKEEEINRSSWKSYFTISHYIKLENGWGGDLSTYLEPIYRTQERTYKTVYGVYGKIYKYLLKNKLMLNLNFTVYAHNRRIITNTIDVWSESHYKTNETKCMIGATYNFKGGKKVTAKQSKSILNYYEYKDN